MEPTGKLEEQKKVNQTGKFFMLKTIRLPELFDTVAEQWEDIF